MAIRWLVALPIGQPRKKSHKYTHWTSLGAPFAPALSVRSNT
nr:hypothetical protein [Pantoea varia]